MSIISIGTGSGTLPSLSTLGLSAGDTVKIKAGSYPGINVSGLSGINFVPDGGVVNFTSSIFLGNTNNITFDGLGISPYGFKYSGVTFSVFNSGVGGNVSLTVKGFDFGNTANTAFDSQTKIQIPAWSGPLLTYIGSPQSTVFTNLFVYGCKISGKTSMHLGTYEPTTTYHMVCIGCHYENILVVNDGTGSTIKVSGNSMFDIVAKNWTITGDNVTGQADVGVFYLNGNVILDGIKRIGGYGYLIRLIHTSINSHKDSFIQNCIDSGTIAYGSGDVRIDPTTLSSNASIPLLGGNINFYFNVSGDKTDNGSYVTPLVVIGAMTDDLVNKYHVNVVDNLAYNAMQNGMSGNTSLIKDNSGGALIYKSNNVDFPGSLPVGYLVDKISFFPVLGGPLIGAGVSIPSVLIDINGTARPNPPDIGAVQSVYIPPPPFIVSTFSDFKAKTITVIYSDGSSKLIS